MTQDHPRNILLDFLDRDGREMWGAFRDFPEKTHRDTLISALNYACFLCYDFCILPPVFMAVDPLVRDVLRRRSRYLEARVIRLPLRDQSLAAWLDKARAQYAGQAGWYDEIARPDTLDFLSKNASAVIGREGDVGSALVARWEAGPDANPFWRPAREQLGRPILTKALVVPRNLLDDGSAVTWSAIEAQLPPIAQRDKNLLRKMLQHEYFRIYSREYGLAVLHHLPVARIDFSGGYSDPYYDYELFLNLMRAGGIDRLIERVSAQSMVDLRSTIGHHRLQTAHWDLTRLTSNTHEVFEAYAMPIAARDWRVERELSRISSKPTGFNGITLDEGELQIVEQRMLTMATSAVKATEELLDRAEPKSRSRKVSRQNADHKSALQAKAPLLLVFVALQEELDVVATRWNLTNEFGDQAWHGSIETVPVRVVCAHGAGRVRAAVETACYLADTDVMPTLTIVTGIAGGFRETDNTSPGDVIVASNVADLGTRKMREGADGEVPELRIEPYECDSRILNVVRSGSFNEREWANESAQLFDYPRGMLPRVLTGTVVCTDEIVSSDGWRSRLLDAWPKSYGVEMESGGVMAAARRFGGIPVAVVRGVSDNANPLKADNEWRTRAARSAALLIEHTVKVLVSGGLQQAG